MNTKDLLSILELYKQQHLIDYYKKIDPYTQKIFINNFFQAMEQSYYKVPYQPQKTFTELKSISPPIEGRCHVPLINTHEKFACLFLAAGDGTRLNFPYPKACLPIGNKSLLEIHFEAIKRLEQLCSFPIPIGILISQAKGGLILDHLEKNDFFGCKEQVTLIEQKDALFEDSKGNWLMQNPFSLAKGPCGNGDAFYSLFNHPLFKQLKQQNIANIGVIPIDNPFATNCLSDLLNHHNTYDITYSVIRRKNKEEKMGISGVYRNQHCILDYAYLPQETFQDIQKFPYANTNVFCISRAFIEGFCQRVTLPFYRISKQAKIWNHNQFVTKTIYRFEQLITDVTHYGNTHCILFDRESSFLPIKDPKSYELAQKIVAGK